MSRLRFGMVVVVLALCFMMLGFSLRYSEVLQVLWHREVPVPMQSLSDKLAIGKPLPMKERLLSGAAQFHVFVARSELSPWLHHDPEPSCMNDQCGKPFDIVKSLGGTLRAFTNYQAAARAWGIPLISDRWGARPAETVTIITDANGVISSIYRYADLDDLNDILGTTH
jgi:hypothetical protein